MNKKLILKTAGALMAAGTTLGLAAPAAFAQEGDGVGTGNAVDADVKAPIKACGVAAAGLGGDAYAECEAAAQSATSSAGDTAPPTASGDGVVAGNAADIDALVRLLLCGVAVGVAGDAEAYCGP